MKKAIGITGLVLLVVPVLFITMLGFALFALYVSETAFFGVQKDPDYVMGIIALIASLLAAGVPVAGYISFLLEKKVPAAVLLGLFVIFNMNFLPLLIPGFIGSGSAMLSIAIIVTDVLSMICAITALVYALKEFR